MLKQITVFLVNKTGRMEEVTGILADKNINLHALSIADTTDFGILRLLVNKPEEAYATLKESGYTSAMTKVIAVEMADRPGGLGAILQLLDENKVQIEYMYAFVAQTHKTAYAILRVDDIEAAVALFAKNNVKVLTGEELYNY